MYTHSQLNRLQLKEQQEINRERKMMEQAELEKKEMIAQQQKSRFEHVKSNGYGKNAPNGPVDDVEIKVFVNECEDNRRMFTIMESSVSQPQSVNSAREVAKVPNPKSSTPSLPPVAARGVVPDYLLKRKAEMQAEKEAIQKELERQQEIAKFPPGHRPVTEEERVDILDKLATRKKELQMEMHKLPVRFDTQAVRQRRIQIESEMAETEAAERKFSSKKQLFVPI